MKNLILFLVFIISINALGQSSENKELNRPKNITYILDNKIINKDVLRDLNRDSILAITILKDSNAVKITKNENTDAVVSAISTAYAKAHHLDYLKSKSVDFANAYSSIQNPNEVIFIWNDEVLDKRKENMLYFIDDRNFIEIKTINQEKLINDFNIKDKQLGFVVKTIRKDPQKQ